MKICASILLAYSLFACSPQNASANTALDINLQYQPILDEDLSTGLDILLSPSQSIRIVLKLATPMPLATAILSLSTEAEVGCTIATPSACSTYILDFSVRKPGSQHFEFLMSAEHQAKAISRTEHVEIALDVRELVEEVEVLFRKPGAAENADPTLKEISFKEIEFLADEHAETYLERMPRAQSETLSAWAQNLSSKQKILGGDFGDSFIFLDESLPWSASAPFPIGSWTSSHAALKRYDIKPPLNGSADTLVVETIESCHAAVLTYTFAKDASSTDNTKHKGLMVQYSSTSDLTVSTSTGVHPLDGINGSWEWPATTSKALRALELREDTNFINFTLKDSQEPCFKGIPWDKANFFTLFHIKLVDIPQ